MLEKFGRTAENESNAKASERVAEGFRPYIEVRRSDA